MINGIMLQKYLYYTSIMPDAPEIALNYAQNDTGIIRQTIRWAINLRPGHSNNWHPWDLS